MNDKQTAMKIKEHISDEIHEMAKQFRQIKEDISMNIKTFGTQKNAQVIEIKEKQGAQLRYTFEYDTLHPEQKLRSFIMDIQEMKARYDQNLIRIKEIEDSLFDIEHYMEISSYKNIREGYRLYRKLAELRRERRALKSENDILKPVSEYFRTTSTLDKIANVQGDVARMQGLVDQRVYTVRTDILDEFMKLDEEREKTDEVCKDIPAVPENLISIVDAAAN